MEVMCLCLVLWGFLLDSGASEPVFLSASAAGSVLRRHRRHNTGVFEELLQGNLERECMEESCDLEEAREIFENDQQTMEFWAAYIDGNQCKPNPCLNQGVCQDQLGTFTCTCPSGLTGRTCEIVVSKRCDLNNGGCMHFCEPIGTFGAKCSCATGYKLLDEGMCDPEVEFPCGKTALTEVGDVYRRSLFGHGNSSLLTENFTTATPALTAPLATAETVPNTTDSEELLPLGTLPPWYNDTEGPTEEPIRPFKRIVGGEVVAPGEIPWQVALILHPSGEMFCGGSILSPRWVITAAHCLAEVGGKFIVRVGEYNVLIKEDSEQDYEVSEQHRHPRYNASLSLYNHDIALLYLEAPIAFSTTVRPICIGPRGFTEALVRDSSPATVSGWGRTRFLGATSNVLQKVEVPAVDRTRCKQSSSARVSPFMFCAGYYDEDKDACQGDSGGPHANSVHDTWFLSGIVSWGEECAKDGKYGVYTRVSLYYRWINHVTGLSRQRGALDMEDPEMDI